MADEMDGPDSTEPASPDWGQIGLGIVAVAVLVLGAMAAPTFAGTTIVEAPQIDSSVDDPPSVDAIDGAGLGADDDDPGEDDGEPHEDDDPTDDGPGGDGPGDGADGEPGDGGPGDGADGEPGDGGPGDEGPDDEVDDDPGGDGDRGPPSADEETRIGGDAEFTAADETVHFTVRAGQPSYWRLSAYDEYDSDGWIRSADQPAIEDVPAADDRDVLLQEVVPEVGLSTAPAAWRPVDVDHPTASFSPDSAGGFQADETLEPGVPMRIASVLPENDPDRLAAAGTDYPEAIEERYTDLPEDVPDRVYERTGEITADAENPYETADSIAAWFRANRGYSLDVPPPDGDVTDELLFEREEAYCAYFATAMTVMLRAEGVPARYVVGYNAGEYDAEADEFVVRGMHAHAWVEVYFPDVGWVPFEPTPPGERSEAIGDAIDEGSPAADEFDIGEDDPEMDWFDDDDEPADDPAADDPASDPDDDEEPEDDGAERDEDEDDPEDDGAERDEDEDEDEDDGGERDEDEDEDEDDGGERDEDEDEDDPEDDGGERDEDEDEDEDDPEDDGAERDEDEDDPPTDDAPPEYNVTIEGEPVPGTEVTVVVTENDEPVEGATVYFDGDRIGTTDADGTVDGEVPFTETLEIVVEPPPEVTTSQIDRGIGDGGSGSSGGGSTPGGSTGPFVDGGSSDLVLVATDPTPTVDSTNLTVETDGRLDVSIVERPLPNRQVLASVTIEDTPIPAANLSIDGETVGTTDADGNAEIQLPDRTGTITIAALRGEIRGETEIDLPELDVSIQERPMPGKHVTVEGAAGEEPFSGAVVSVDGDELDTTDSDGIADVRLPETTGNVTVALQREQVRVTETIEIRPLSLASETRFPLPGRSAGFVLNYDDDPVANATVAIEGETVGTTDANGSVTASLPIAGAASVQADRRGATASTTVDGLYRNAAIAIGLPLAVLVGILWWSPATLGTARSVPGRVLTALRSTRTWLGRLAIGAVDRLVAIARYLERFGLWLRASAVAAFERLLEAVEWLRTLPSEIATRGLAALSGLHPAALFELLRSFAERKCRDARDRLESTAATIDDRIDGDDTTREPVRSLRELWVMFLRIVDPPAVGTKTPGEIKRYAIARGFPERPVETVVETFRKSEYGRRPPSDEQLARVERAVDATADRSDDDANEEPSDDRRRGRRSPSGSGHP